jgi:hypothetical protein
MFFRKPPDVQTSSTRFTACPVWHLLEVIDGGFQIHKGSRGARENLRDLVIGPMTQFLGKPCSQTHDWVAFI